jgi:hypothetical protein
MLGEYGSVLVGGGDSFVGVTETLARSLQLRSWALKGLAIPHQTASALNTGRNDL